MIGNVRSQVQSLLYPHKRVGSVAITNVQRCGGLSVVLLAATERHLGTTKEQGISSQFQVFIRLQYDFTY